MNRFHIVVSNYQRIQSFTHNFGKIVGFNPSVDSVFIFDSSSESNWQLQLEITDTLRNYGLEWGKSLFFLKRRNWGLNEGTFLDYFRCVKDGIIIKPSYVAFMQEHYLDTQHFVNDDTIPADITVDLNEVDYLFHSDASVGCIFYPRRGIRVCTSNPITEKGKEFFGDSDELIPGAVRRCFCVDGGNFITRPEPYIDFFNSNIKYLTQGDGSYGFTHVWEVRKGQILFNRGIKWVDMYRGIAYNSIREVDTLEKEQGKKVSALWYDNRTWYFFYGRDQWKYPPMPVKSFLAYIKNNWRTMFVYSRDIHLEFCQPKQYRR